MDLEFPKLDLDAKKKDKNWALQYAKAAFNSYSAGGWNSLFNNRNRYRELTDYALNNQSVDKYKRILKADESQDASYKNMSWKPLPILPKLLELAMAITKKADYDIVATPIDPVSREEIDRYFSTQETKIRMRKEMEKIDPALVEVSPLAKNESEPSDLEELELQRMYSYKHTASIEIEQFLQQIFLNNNIEEIRAEIKRSILYYGIAAVKEYVDQDGLIKMRNVNISNMICSRVTRRDFKDAEFVGEIIEINPQDLIEMANGEIDEAMLKEIVNSNSKSLSSYSMSHARTPGNFHDNKIRILDIEWLAYDPIAFERKVDKYGNIHMARTSPDRAEKSQFVKTIYRCYWVMGTEYVFGFGKSTDIKRRRSALQDTSLSYHIFAPNFDYFTMSAPSKVENAMSIVDQMSLAWYRLQHVIAKARPKGLIIEIGALEDVPLAKGGQQLSVKDLVEVYETTGNIYYRQRDIDGNMSNYRPIQEMDNGIGQQAQEYMSIIQYNINLLKDVIGINEATDSFTGQRTYSAAVNAGIQATNNSLYTVIEADREIMQSLADALVLRIQSVVRSGRINPMYISSLGQKSIDFFKKGKNLSAAEFGISLDPVPTDAERQLFYGRLEKLIDSGQVDIDDVIMLESMRSMKAASAILAYKVKKKREKAQAQQEQMMQMNAQAQQQSAMLAEQAKQQTMQMQAQIDAQMLQMKQQGEMALKQLDLEMQYLKTKMASDTGLSIEQIKAESKEYIAELLNKAREQRNPGQVTTDMMK